MSEKIISVTSYDYLPRLEALDFAEPYIILRNLLPQQQYAISMMLIDNYKAECHSYSRVTDPIELIRRFQQELEQLGLLTYWDENNWELYFSKSVHDIKMLQDYLNSVRNGEGVSHLFLGDLYGYPQTAIVAFMEKSLLEWSEIPTNIQEHVLYPFLSFRLSKQHYLSEWQSFVTLINKFIKLYPEIANVMNFPSFELML